jgi:enamine deaminase RidA (YjgF/YER057c/UK114 family)
MVVSDPANPTGQEAARQALLESWCYAVTLIDDSATQAEYDAAAAAVDVAYLSPEILASEVGEKLKAKTIGVVNEDPGLHTVFGFSSVRYQDTTNAALTTDAAYYITSPFGGGAVTLYTSDQPSGAAVGTLPSGLETIGTWSSGTLSSLGGLLTLEPGAAISGGGMAAGRRVQLPWDGVDGGSVADIGALTDDGRTIMRRSLEWAAGAVSAQSVLLVVVDASSLSSKESAGKALMESWGYAVATINADASQADYDAALALVDVVYISGSISSDDLGTKLTAATVGVLSEDAGLVDELGIAEPVFIQRNTQFIEIIDNTHYVTSGLSIGDLQVFSSSQDVWTVGGALAPGLQILGETKVSGTGFPPGVAVLETGAALYGGGFAAGRRVQVPWSIGSAFEYSALTADGLDIMKRAIEWGAGAGGSAPPPPSCDDTFRDEFNHLNFSGNDGTLSWTGDWQEVGESDGPTAGDVRVDDPETTFELQIRDNDNGGEGVEREADLSGAGSATLSLDYQRQGLDNANDYVKVEVSANGAAGPWDEIARFEGPATDSSYQPFNGDISAYISNNTRVRLKSSPDMGPVDVVWFDNVEICLGQ